MFPCYSCSFVFCRAFTFDITVFVVIAADDDGDDGDDDSGSGNRVNTTSFVS